MYPDENDKFKSFEWELRNDKTGEVVLRGNSIPTSHEYCRHKEDIMTEKEAFERVYDTLGHLQTQLTNLRDFFGDTSGEDVKKDIEALSHIIGLAEDSVNSREEN